MDQLKVTVSHVLKIPIDNWNMDFVLVNLNLWIKIKIKNVIKWMNCILLWIKPIIIIHLNASMENSKLMVYVCPVQVQ